MHVNRRQFLMPALAAPAVATGQESSTPLIDRGFARVTRAADSVNATIAGPGGPQCVSNGAVIAVRDATLIVEGHFFPEGAELEIEVARMVSKAPVRAAERGAVLVCLHEERFQYCAAAAIWPQAQP